MKHYKKMFIWENIKRTNELISFRNLVTKYFNNAPCHWMADGRVENDEAVESRRQINLVIDKICQFVSEAGIPTTIYYSPPPAIGGLSGDIDLLANIFNLHKFQISKDTLSDKIERAIGVYQNDKTKAWIRTLNPLFWIYLILNYLVSLPFKLLWLAGFDRARIESSFAGKLLKMIISIITVGAAFLTVLEKLDYLESFKSLITR